MPIDFSDCTSGNPNNCGSWRVQTVKVCVVENHGNGAVGTPCSQPTDCRSNLCTPGQNLCTDTCSNDGDCPSGFECKADEYFQLPGGVEVYFNVCLPHS